MPPRAAIITVSPATNAPRLATPFTAPAIGTRLKTFILPDKESNKADKEPAIAVVFSIGRLPRDKNITVIPAITTPIRAVVTIALFTIFAAADNTPNMATKAAIAPIVLNKLSALNFPMASKMPLSTFPSSSAPTTMSSGTRSDNVSSNPIIKSNSLSVISGAYSANALNASYTSFKRASAIKADVEINALHPASIIATNASDKVEAPSPITFENSIIPSPISLNKSGISPIRFLIIATNAAPPATPDTAKAESPAAKAATPAPTAKVPIPNKVITPDKANNVGITGVNNLPATPMIAKEPASIVRPLAILPHSIFPRALMIGVNMASAAEIVNNAAAPGRPVLISLRAATNITIAPDITTALFPISSHPNPLICFITSPNISIDAAIPATAAAFFTLPLGIIFRAMPTERREPAITLRPFPISFHLRSLKELMAFENISIDDAITVMPIEALNMLLEFEVSLVNIASSASIPPTAASPLVISPALRSLNLETALANIFIALAKITSPAALIGPTPSKSATFINNASSAQSTPTPTNPVASSPQLREDNFFTADDNISTAVDNAIIEADNFAIPIKPAFPSIRWPNIDIEPNN